MNNNTLTHIKLKEVSNKEFSKNKNDLRCCFSLCKINGLDILLLRINKIFYLICRVKLKYI